MREPARREPRCVTDAISPGVKEANAKVGVSSKKREVTRERLRMLS